MNEQKRWEHLQNYHLRAAEAADQAVKAIKNDNPTTKFITAQQDYRNCVAQIDRLTSPVVDETEFAEAAKK